MSITVIKRDNREEEFNFDKIYQHILESTKGLDVDKSKLIENMKLRMVDKMKSKHIQQTLIFACADLIYTDEPDWQFAAARLLLQDLYKDIYGSYDPHFNYNTLKTRVKKKFYDKEILDYYTESEINELSTVINYKRDLDFTYLGLKQMMLKYSIRRNDKSIETPQEIFFVIPLYLFARVQNKVKRASLVKKYYTDLSTFKIFLSTPPMVGIRTSMRGFTSCAGIHYGDSIESFGNASKSMLKLITKLRAGVGGDGSLIRGLDADIGNGVERHTGITPYLKIYESISKSSTQPNSGRSGAVTNYYPFFHWEIEDILQLKNNKGSDESSVRFSDHAIIFNDYFYQRVKEDKDITLFHMNDLGDLPERIGEEDFGELYESFERKRNIKKKKISAKLLLERYYNERYSTARNYKIYADEMQRHGAFDLPNYKSNLCTEINLPSFPDEDFKFKTNNPKLVIHFVEGLYEEGNWYQLYRFIQFGMQDDKNKEIVKQFKKMIQNGDKEVIINFGEIFSCILGGVNIGTLSLNKEKRRKELERLMSEQIRFLDEMIDYQDYVGITAFERFTKNRRALGISPGNLFYLLARAGFDYNSQEARDLVNDVMEEMLFYGLKASMELAKEKGKCKWFNDTKYSKGILPIDTYNKNVDRYISKDHLVSDLPWDDLRNDIVEHGLRNSTILTVVPSSNSSRPANMISGINPPQALNYNIEDQKMKISGLLPDVKKYKAFYERNLAWKIDMLEYIKLIAIFQKWVDQSISLNEYVDYTKYPNKKIPMSEVMKRDILMNTLGVKGVYYAKTKTDDDAEELVEEQACSGGGCTL